MTEASGASRSARPLGRSRFRRSVQWLHTWIGLTFGLALVFLAVTGGVLATRPFLEERVYSGLMRAPACRAPSSLDDLVAKARAVHPGGKAQIIELRREAGSSVAVQFGDKDYVYLDPCGGRVLGVQNEYGGLFGISDWLHRFKFADNGKWYAGTIDVVVLFAILIGGLFLWWPRNRASVRSGLVYNGKLPANGRRLSLHRVVGVYVSAMLLAQTVTGLPIAFQWGRDLIATATGSSAEAVSPPPPPAPVKGKALKMEVVWARFRGLAPDWTWADVGLPKKGMVRVEYRNRAAVHDEAKSYIYLDARSGAPIRVVPYATGTPLGRKVYLWDLALHRGLVGGVPFDIALLLMCLAVVMQAYTGIGSYLRRTLRKPERTGLAVKVAAKTLEAEGVCSFELIDPKGRPLPPFSAGSHIDLTIRPGLVRQYSLCNDPRETHRYLIAVALSDVSRGGSKTLHDDVDVGDLLQASLPKNHFPLAHGPVRSLLVAGGIGITPILCMAERLANIGEDFELHYCTRSMARAAFARRIAQAGWGDRVRYHVTEAGGRLDLRGLLSGEARTTHIYVCGPTRLIEETSAQARALGWPEALIHCEYFKGADLDRSQDHAFEVKIASTGQTVLVPKDRSVVEALAEIGIPIPMSCAEGVCGTCVTRVIEGEVAHRDRVLTAAERARNDQFTPCCSRSAGGALVLDL